MPTPSTSAFGRLARKLVNERRTVQINGKMLIASNRAMVGPTNSHAMARSESPRTVVASRGGVACAARSIALGEFRLLIEDSKEERTGTAPAAEARRGPEDCRSSA